VPNLIEIVIHATDAASAEITRAEEALTGLEAASAKLVGFLMSPGGLLLGFAGVGAAAFEMADHFGTAIQQLQNMSDRTNISMNDLRNLQVVLRESHLPTENLSVALTMLNRNLANHKEALVAVVGNVNTPMEALIKLSERVQQGGNAAKIAFDAFGRGGMALAPVLEFLASRLDDVKSRLTQLDPATIETAKKFDEMVEKLKTRAMNMTLELNKEILQTITYWQAFGVWWATLGDNIAHGRLITDDAHSPDKVRQQFLDQAAGQSFFDIVTRIPETKREGFDDGTKDKYDPGAVRLAVTNGISLDAAQKLWDSQKNIGLEHLGAAQGLARGEFLSPITGGKDIGLEHLREIQQFILTGLWPAQKKVKDEFLDWGKINQALAAQLSNDFGYFFNTVLGDGFKIMHDFGTLVKQIAIDLASTMAMIGLGTGLVSLAAGATGGVLGFIGKVGKSILPHSAGRAGAGGTTIINNHYNSLDQRSLRMSIQFSGGSFRQAQHNAGLGMVY
jgi:hypothetical protein